MIISILFLMFCFLILAFISEWVERKVVARAQSRVGPLFAGPKGILQPLADFIKLMLKEEINPVGADRLLLTLIPILSATMFMFTLFFIPIWGPYGYLSLPGDLIFLLGISAIFGGLIIMTGYSNPGPYSNIGAARYGELFISYEVPFVLSAAAPAIIAGTVTVGKIVEYQCYNGIILGVFAPIGLLIMFLSTMSKLERVPFDVGEAETEIAAGWQVELSGRRLAFYRLALNLELIFGVGLIVSLYLGGPTGVFLFEPLWLSCTIWFFIKFFIVLIIVSIFEALMARFRIDQVLNIFWKYITPLAILQIILAFIVKYYLAL